LVLGISDSFFREDEVSVKSGQLQQPSPASLDTGLPQPDAVRTGLARCPGKASRI